MNYKPLPIGIDNFEMLITRGYYFTDKTMLMYGIAFFGKDCHVLFEE